METTREPHGLIYGRSNVKPTHGPLTWKHSSFWKKGTGYASTWQNGLDTLQLYLESMNVRVALHPSDYNRPGDSRS